MSDPYGHGETCACERCMAWSEGYEEGRGELQVRLHRHYLAGIECDHEAKTDKASCACSMVALPAKPTVGEAVATWIEHVLTL